MDVKFRYGIWVTRRLYGQMRQSDTLYLSRYWPNTKYAWSPSWNIAQSQDMSWSNFTCIQNFPNILMPHPLIGPIPKIIHTLKLPRLSNHAWSSYQPIPKNHSLGLEMAQIFHQVLFIFTYSKFKRGPMRSSSLNFTLFHF